MLFIPIVISKNLVFVKVALSPLLKNPICKMIANKQNKEHKLLLMQEL